MGKSIEATMEILEEIAINTYQWPSKCNIPKKTLGVHELDVLTNLSSQMDTLFKQMSSLTTQANMIRTLVEMCDLYGGLDINT